MVATAQHYKTPPSAGSKPEQPARYISWEHFQRRYLDRDDGYTYEWTNGKVEKSPGAMDITQLYIWLNINRFFQQFLQKRPLSGSLITEADIFLSETRHRRPDICFLLDEQILAGKTNRVQVPAFVIEVVSPTDSANKVSRKVQEYFEAGVKVVWNIYPELQEVHVFESATAALICRRADLCSAATAIPGFAMRVEDIFAE